MSFSPQLLALVEYLAGEFDNQQQAMAEPTWFVHIRLWQRPISLFFEDSLTLFAEQANTLNLDNPYRQRIMRLREGTSQDSPLQVQYYMPKDPSCIRGAGRHPALLDRLTLDQVDLLPGCVLNVNYQKLGVSGYKFIATPLPNTSCCFSYRGSTIYVVLGFEALQNELNSHDKGIDPATGRATWGAVMGPYCYVKREQY